MDIWAYKDQSHLWHQTHLLIPPVKQAGFYSQDTPQGKWRVYMIPLKDYQIQVSQQEEVRQSFAWELAGEYVYSLCHSIAFCYSDFSFYYSSESKALRGFQDRIKTT